MKNDAAKNAEAILVGLPEMDDETAIRLVNAIATEYRFVGAMFTPSDVRENITEWFDADDVEREVTDADVEAMLNTWEWRKGIGEVLSNEGGEMIVNAYNDTFDADGNIRSSEEGQATA